MPAVAARSSDSRGGILSVRAAEQGYAGDGARWPVQWEAGRRKPPTSRTDKIPPRLSLLRAAPAGIAHLRWMPAEPVSA